MANAPIQQIGIGNAYQIIGADRYPGPYEVTPAREAQLRPILRSRWLLLLSRTVCLNGIA